MIEKEYFSAFLTAVNEFVKAEAAKKAAAKYTPAKGRYIGSKAPTEKRKVGDIVFNDGRSIR